MTASTFGALYSQVSFLDTVFPGLSVALSYIQPLTSGTSHLGARLLCMYGLVTFLLRYANSRIARIMEKHFIFTFHISYNDDAYDILQNWIKSQPFAAQSRSTIVTLERESEATVGGGTTKKVLKYKPWNFRKLFWFKRNLLCLRSVQEEGLLRRQNFWLSCIGFSPEIMKEFLHDCNLVLEKQTQSKTAIYVNGDGRWDLAMRRCQKRMETVILPEDVKKDFLNDISEYLDPEARAWYIDHDLPYRRGYLLHGEPGTGKSSLSLAAAGYFDLDVYVMNLSKVSDATLHKFLGKLPTRCIILLEDIDVIESAKSRGDNGPGPNKEPPGNSVTLSGLLNAIDGVASKEGRVLIMTTNYVNRIDPALIRPGRVDKMVEFGLASREMLLGLFRYIYMPLPNETDRAGEKVKVTTEKQDTQEIQQLAVAFADRVPEMKYSPAKILSFLIAHKRSPRDAVDNIISWVERGGEGFVTLRRQTSAMSTMSTMNEEIVQSSSFTATAGMVEFIDDRQTWTVVS